MIVLLDLDGTLSDSAPGIVSSVVHALTSLGAPVPSADVLRSFLGPPLHESFARLGLGDPWRAVELYREHYRAAGLTDTSAYDGVVPLLVSLRSWGARLAVTTSKPTVFAERVVQLLGLDVDVVVGSELDGSRSRKADVIDEALRVLSVVDRSSVVMVGDRAEDALGAAQCGVRFVGAGWGYGRPGELETVGAPETAQTPLDLLDLLARPG